MPAPSSAAQTAAIDAYLAAVGRALARGDATEHIYRPFPG
jgi:hypothetical protein